MKLSFEHLNMSNGLQVFLQPMSVVSSVSVYVAVKAGPKYETKETCGIAHFLEHMLFEGTMSFPSARELAESIENVGGRSGAYTEKEYVLYFVKVPDTKLKIAFSYLSDILFNSLLSDEAIEKEKKIVMEEINRKTDNPEIQIWDSGMEWVWGDNHFLGRSTLGNQRSINNITKDKLEEYLKNFYFPHNMAIAIVGNFSKKEAKKYAEEFFGKKSKGEKSTFISPKYKAKKNHTKILNVNTLQTNLLLGFVTDVSYGHKDYYAVKLIADILSVGVSSRLFNRLIYEMGLAYSAGAGFWPFSDLGIFYISGGFAAENVEKSLKIIFDELIRLQKKKVKDNELRNTKEKTKSLINFSLESFDSMAYLHSVQLITEDKIEVPAEMFKKINNMSSDDIQRVANKYFNLKNLFLIVRGPVDINRTQSIERIIKEKFQ